MNSLKIGISGKRYIGETEKSMVCAAMKERIQEILHHHHATRFTGYTSLASGSDSLFAEMVLKEFKQPVHVILPFPLEEYKKDFQGKDLEVLESLLQACGPYEVAESATPTSPESRNEAYYKAGKVIADTCQAMVIVWDGLKPRGHGGTADILAYLAEKRGHEASPYILVKPEKPDPLNNELLHGYETANKKAIAARNRHRRVWKFAIILGWLTVLCFSCKSALPLEWPFRLALTAMELGFVSLAFILIIVASQRKYHTKYLRERLKAETFRLLVTFYQASVEVGISEQSREKQTMLAIMADKINQYLKSHEAPSEWFTRYAIKSLIHEQIGYHEGKVKTIGNKHQFIGTIKWIIGILFFGNLCIDLFCLIFFKAGAEGSSMERWTIFMNILLPASYAAVEGFNYFNEWASLKTNSQTVGFQLREAEKQLPADPSTAEVHSEQARVLNLVAGIMLADNQNWNRLLEFKGEYQLFV